MIVVEPEVTRLKLEREFELWHENAETYRRRGWILLGRDDLAVDAGFLGRLLLGARPVPAMTACVRIDFTNYDLWPPSVEFIDPFTGEYVPPPVQALVDSDEDRAISSSTAIPTRTGRFSAFLASASTTTTHSTLATRGSSTATPVRAVWPRSATASGAQWPETYSASISSSRPCLASSSCRCGCRTLPARWPH